MNKINALTILIAFKFAIFSGAVFADYSKHEKAQAFIEMMVSEHGFSRDELGTLLSKAEQKESILKAIARPAEKRLEWKGYRKIFLTKDRIKKGKVFIKKHQKILEKAESEFGVPIHVIAAIIGVETRYGHNKGSYRVIDALATLAFDYPPRSKFFTSELKHSLLLSKEQGFNPLELKGSYAGAMGFGQFIPSSYRHYAIDFDGDGVADILNNVEDAIGSVANYFKMHKWKPGQAVAKKLSDEELGANFKKFGNEKLKLTHTVGAIKAGGVVIPDTISSEIPAKIHPFQGSDGEENWLLLDNFYVITRYNHSHLYALAVFQLSEELKKS